MNITLRLARPEDVPAIGMIFNYYVLHSTSTFYTEPLTDASRSEWLSQRSERHPVIVAEEGAEIIGWAALSEFKSRQAYADTVEISVYIRHDRRRLGVGRQLMTDLIRRAREAGFHTIIAGTCAEQTASLVLQKELGFRQVAHLTEVGRKFDRWLDVVYSQLMLDNVPHPKNNGTVSTQTQPPAAPPA